MADLSPRSSCPPPVWAETTPHPERLQLTPCPRMAEPSLLELCTVSGVIALTVTLIARAAAPLLI